MHAKAVTCSFLLGLCACTTDPSPSSPMPAALPAGRVPTEPAVAPNVTALKVDAPTPSESPASVVPVAAPRADKPSAPAPSDRCVMQGERVFRAVGTRALLAGDGVSLALLAWDTPSKLALYTGTRSETLALAGELSLKAALSRATLVVSGQRVVLAYVDERGVLLLSELRAGALTPPQQLAEGVNRRFAPALTLLGERALVAFTRTVDDAMHTFVAQVRGSHVQLNDVTPQGHGAAAATFVLGHSLPSLVMIDARAGVSPLLEVPFDAAGSPQPAVVRTPVSQPFAPPLLAAVQLAAGHVEVAYTATGSAAATAIGRVPLRTLAQPVPLEPSKGYGELSFSAVLGRRRAVFALEVPKHASADPARELWLHVVGVGSQGPALVVPQAPETASFPSLAPGPTAGSFVLVYTSRGALYLSDLLCDA